VSDPAWVNGRTVPPPGVEDGGSYGYRPDDVWRVAAAQACIGYRCGALMQMPLKAYRDVNGLPQPLDSQPPLLVKPSRASKVPSVWKARMSISRDMYGYALGVITAVEASGYPAMVEWVPAGDTRSKVVNAYGELEWRIGGEVWDSARLVHLPSRWVTNEHPEGMAPLEYAGLLDLSKRIRQYGHDWFTRGGVPSAILYSDQTLTQSQAEDMVTRIRTKWRRNQPAVLGSAMKYEQVSAKANESEFLNAATHVAADIALAFSMPPEKVGAAITGQSITYANRDQAQQQWLIDSLNPDLRLIEEHTTLLFPRSMYTKWQTGALLQSDVKTQAEVNATEIKSGIRTPNEARALRELPPLTDEQWTEFERLSKSTPKQEVPNGATTP
jgi:hypothetical protein